jgi:hypothetical protein
MVLQFAIRRTTLVREVLCESFVLITCALSLRGLSSLQSVYSNNVDVATDITRYAASQTASSERFIFSDTTALQKHIHIHTVIVQ